MPSAPSRFSHGVWRTRTPMIGSAVGTRQVPTGGSEKRSLRLWCRSLFGPPGVGPIVKGATPGLSAVLINHSSSLNFLHSMYVYVTWRRSASTGPESLRAYRSERAEPKGCMGLTLIGGLTASVQPGTGPRRLLTLCQAGGRHILCCVTTQSCEGICHIPNDIVRAWV